MKIPKYIDEALQKRANAAFKFLQYDDVVSIFIEKHNIDVNFDYYCGGVGSITNPNESANAVREAILTHKNNKEKRMTNFERIKNMSVDEIASEIDRISNYLCDDYECKECPLNFLENRNCNATEFANWLNSEVEE